MRRREVDAGNILYARGIIETIFSPNNIPQDKLTPSVSSLISLRKKIILTGVTALLMCSVGLYAGMAGTWDSISHEGQLEIPTGHPVIHKMHIPMSQGIEILSLSARVPALVENTSHDTEVRPSDNSINRFSGSRPGTEMFARWQLRTDEPLLIYRL